MQIYCHQKLAASVVPQFFFNSKGSKGGKKAAGWSDIFYIAILLKRFLIFHQKAKFEGSLHLKKVQQPQWRPVSNQIRCLSFFTSITALVFNENGAFFGPIKTFYFFLAQIFFRLQHRNGNDTISCRKRMKVHIFFLK